MTYGKRAKTLPIKGLKDDAGKLYRCWNCNTVCNTDKNSRGGKDSTGATAYIDYATPPAYADAYSKVIDLTNILVMPELEADGTPVQATHVFRITGGGCPLCHTENWDGKYRKQI